jgi:predicted GIY-YIG superfamily endonuclease
MGAAQNVAYLLHFSEKISDHAGHYLGSAKDLDHRLGEHARGQGARLTQVAVERGISWDLVRTWPGGRQQEYRLKRQHNGPRLCPLCRPRLQTTWSSHVTQPALGPSRFIGILPEHPWRVTAVTPRNGNRWSTCTERLRTYLDALAQARRLAWEAEPMGGHIQYVRSARQAIEGYVVTDAEGELCALILIWRTGQTSPRALGAGDVAAG